MNLLLAAVIGYLAGSIPVGYLIGLTKGIDVRKYGSGATGGTNVQRTLGWGPAVATGVSDILKGSLGAYVGFLLGGDWGYALGGFFATVGHSYPVWLSWRGGKSVATGGGALAVFHPLGFLAGLAAGFATIVPTRYVSLGSLVGGLVYGAVVIIPDNHVAHKLLAVGTISVVYIRHWENMKRLASGTENKFGQKAKPRTEP